MGGQVRMEKFISKHGFKLILLLIVVVAGVALLSAKIAGGGKTAEFALKEEAPDFELEHVDGSTVSLSGTNGKVRLVYFYFSHCPDVCPPSTQILAEVQNLLKESGDFGERAQLMSITFDPERDTRERLLEFSGYYNADHNGWYFLRGEKQYTHDLAYDYGVMIQEKEDGTFAHSNIFFLIDKDGYIRKYYPVDPLDTMPEDIVKDMKALM
jgi:protein SCO1/2